MVMTLKERASANALLIEAVKNNSLEDVRSALELGASANASIDNFRHHVLMLVQTPEIASALLERGANPFFKDRTRQTLLDELKELSKKNAALLPVYSVVQHYAQKVPVEKVKKSQGKKTLRKSLSNENKSFLSQELIAAVQNHASLAKIRNLLEQGANPNVLDLNGKTPLMFVSDVRVGKLLMEYGADPHAKDLMGRTVLMHAATCSLTQLFLNAGVDVNAVCSEEADSLTALSFVQTKTQLSLLIKAGADLTVLSSPNALEIVKRRKDADFLKSLTALQNKVLKEQKKTKKKEQMQFATRREEALKRLKEKQKDLNRQLAANTLWAIRNVYRKQRKSIHCSYNRQISILEKKMMEVKERYLREITSHKGAEKQAILKQKQMFDREK